MRSLSIVIVAGGAALTAAVVAALLIGLYSSGGYSGKESLRITVSEGEPFSSVVSRLEEVGLVAHPGIVRLYAIARGFDRSIRAGTYRFSPGTRAIDIVRMLVEGDVLKSLVTIPEGLTIWETASILSKEAGIDSAAFVAVAGSSQISAKMGIDAPSLEGYLFPDTYVIPWGMEPMEAVTTMVGRFREVFDDSLRRRADALGMSVEDVVTLASIIEAETALPDERPLVSAVYHNRLSRGMKLEADPTVAYAKGGYRGMLSREDLSIDSPYNTYAHPGLPPGPVCSPGKASMGAALYPQEGFTALYFVATGDGGHVFSMTLKEHLAAVARVKRERASAH